MVRKSEQSKQPSLHLAVAASQYSLWNRDKSHQSKTQLGSS